MTDETGRVGAVGQVRLIWSTFRLIASLIMLSTAVQFGPHLSLNGWITGLLIITVKKKFPISNGIFSVQWHVLLIASTGAFNMNETWDIFGTKSQGLGLKISTHISNWKVMMSWCWIIKQPDPKPISDKSVVYFFQNPVVQTIIIKWKKIYDVLWCHIWWKSSSSKIKSNFAEILSVLSLKPLKTQKKDLVQDAHLCSKWQQMAMTLQVCDM